MTSDPALVLVFDDGYREDYDRVRPVLEAAGVPACLAIVPRWVGHPGHLDRSHLDELVGAGWEIAAHGRRHRYLQAHGLARDAAAGDDRLFLEGGHVFPGEDHAVYPGDSFEVTDGERRDVVDIVAKGEEGEPHVEVADSLGNGYAAGEAVVRPTADLLEDEIGGVRSAFRDLGVEPRTFVFPYDAADARAWSIARDRYEVIPNAAVRSLPNPPGTPLSNLRRYYLETDSMTLVEIETYLDELVDRGGVGVLAGHAAWETVPPERIEAVIEAADDRGIDVTTFESMLVN